MMESVNQLLDTDSYKASHWLQYPPGTKGLFNYLEARKGGHHDHVVFFGLQGLLMQLWQRINHYNVLAAEAFFLKHGVPFNAEGFHRLVDKHCGMLPIRIRALPEGTVAPEGVPLLTVESTDPEFFWLVGYLETQIMRLWYPITVATESRYVKQIIRDYMLETCDTLDKLPFMLHDFGSRGVSCREQAAIGGAAHLVNFQGSDTVIGVEYANRVYRHDMAAFSLPAAEHSTITSWGKEHEADAYRNMLKQFAKPGSLVAIVSDSYDIYNAVEHIFGEQLKQEIVASGATVIIRPDSGDPVMVVNTVLHRLAEKFGTTTNSKGYRVLNNVRVIQGDGLNPIVIEDILRSTKRAGFSIDNLAFGMGAGLLQKVDRDTQRFAFKCSAIEIQNDNGTLSWRDVVKDPVTDHTKHSKGGRLGTVLGQDGKLTTAVGYLDEANLLELVYEDGLILRDTTLNEVRALADAGPRMK